MKFQTVGATPPGYVAPNPIVIGSPLPSPAPLPPGASVAVGVENAGGWDVEKFSAFIGKGADLAQKVGVDLGPVAGFDFAGAFMKIAAFAGAGAIGGPAGIIVGAVLGIILSIAGVWNRLNDPNWYGVGPGVHDWATRFAPSAFIAQAQADGTNTWPTVKALVEHLLAWWMGTQGVVLSGQGNSHYNGVADSTYLYELQISDPEGPKKFYANAGVDWYATRQARTDANDFGASRNVMMYAIEVKMNSDGRSGLGPADPVPNGSGDVFGDSGGAGSVLLVGGLVLGALLLSGKKR